MMIYTACAQGRAYSYAGSCHLSSEPCKSSESRNCIIDFTLFHYPRLQTNPSPITTANSTYSQEKVDRMIWVEAEYLSLQTIQPGTWGYIVSVLYMTYLNSGLLSVLFKLFGPHLGNAPPRSAFSSTVGGEWSKSVVRYRRLRLPFPVYQPSSLYSYDYSFPSV